VEGAWPPRTRGRNATPRARNASSSLHRAVRAAARLRACCGGSRCAVRTTARGAARCARCLRRTVRSIARNFARAREATREAELNELAALDDHGARRVRPVVVPGLERIE